MIVSFRAQRLPRGAPATRGGIAIDPKECSPYQDDCDSSTAGLRPSARNDSTHNDSSRA